MAASRNFVRELIVSAGTGGIGNIIVGGPVNKFFNKTFAEAGVEIGETVTCVIIDEGEESYELGHYKKIAATEFERTKFLEQRKRGLQVPEPRAPLKLSEAAHIYLAVTADEIQSAINTLRIEAQDQVAGIFAVADSVTTKEAEVTVSAESVATKLSAASLAATSITDFVQDATGFAAAADLKLTETTASADNAALKETAAIASAGTAATKATEATASAVTTAAKATAATTDAATANTKALAATADAATTATKKAAATTNAATTATKALAATASADNAALKETAAIASAGVAATKETEATASAVTTAAKATAATTDAATANTKALAATADAATTATKKAAATTDAATTATKALAATASADNAALKEAETVSSADNAALKETAAIASAGTAATKETEATASAVTTAAKATAATTDAATTATKKGAATTDAATTATKAGEATASALIANTKAGEATIDAATTATKKTAATTDATTASLKAASATTDADTAAIKAAEATAIVANMDATLNGAEIKIRYEGELDTNAYTDGEKSKLAAVNQGVATTDAPTFAGLNITGTGGNVYTDAEVDNLIAGIVADRVWKEPVATFADLATTYPAAVEGWTASVDADNAVYRYDATAAQWKLLANGETPLATAILNGLMASADKAKLDGIETGATADQTGAEIKAGYEGEANTNAYTDTEKTKVAGIEANATKDQTGAEIETLYEARTNTNKFTDTEKTKLVGIEANATKDQTGAEIKTAYDGEPDTNPLTDARASKVDGLNQGVATTDAPSFAGLTLTGTGGNVYTDAEVDNLIAGIVADRVWKEPVATFADLATTYPAPLEGWTASVDAEDSVYRYDADDIQWKLLSNSGVTPLATALINGLMAASDKARLDGIEAGATADQTPVEIEAAYEGRSNTNKFTDAEKTKVASIEAGATADQTGAEVEALYEARSNTNKFTDAEKTKAAGIEANATKDQTGAEIKTAYDGEPDTNPLTDARAAKVDGLNQGVATTDAPSFAGLTLTGTGGNVYTEAEVDNLIAGIVADRIWKPAVANFAALATTYTSPLEGWTASVDDENAVYRYDADTTQWLLLANGETPLATAVLNGLMAAADKAKLDGIEAGATADQTGAEIETLYEARSNTNKFTDAEKTKVAGIEANATKDQTGAEIKTAYEGETNTNALTDALKAKLEAIKPVGRVMTAAGYAAQGNDEIAVNPSGGPITITAPASPVAGTYFKVWDNNRIAGTNNISIDFAAETYEANAADHTFLINVDDFEIAFLFDGATWRKYRG